MSTPATGTFTVAFARPSRTRPTAAPPGRVPRVARLLAFAHEIDRRVRARELDDLAHAARVFGLTRARVTQLVSLTLLAPSIQEAILAMPPVTEGRDPTTERGLRAIVAEPVWEGQVAIWKSLCAHSAVARDAISKSSAPADRTPACHPPIHLDPHLTLHSLPERMSVASRTQVQPARRRLGANGACSDPG
jgi:hypothetical protein